MYHVPLALYTDLLIYLLVIGGGIWFAFAVRREYWRVAVREVMQNRIAMISFGILCIYATVGLLDSIHFRAYDADGSPRGPVTSVLDVICQPLRDSTERTYSAPFAIRSTSKESVIGEDGTVTRIRPYLEYGGAHLAEPREAGHVWDIVWRLVRGLFIGVLFSATYFGILVLIRSKIANDKKRALVFRKGLWVAGFIAVFTVLVATTVSLSSGYHVFGTDKAGGDVLYSALKGVRAGLVIGTLTTLIVTPFAVLFGVLAGYLGGWVDSLIQYIYTTLSSIPSILLIIAGMLILNIGGAEEETIFSADKRLLYLCCVMGVTSWTGLCRMIRGETLKLREVEYIQAADALGVSWAGIIARHLVPNIMHIVLISVVLRFSGLVLAEAVLAYIGVGVDQSMASWGNMINAARMELARDPVVWWQLAAAFVFMFGLVLPANLFGDAVRDALDPKLRTR